MLLIKVVLVGDGAVGKTALRERFLGKDFSTSYLMTIGADFAVKETELSNGLQIKFQIWDLAGQPRFESVRELYYRGASGALLIFDVTRRESFDNQRYWIRELWKNNGKGPVPLVVLGNKIDLREQNPDEDSISNEEGLVWAETLSAECAQHGFSVTYLETSALTGMNVDLSFGMLGQTIEAFLEQRE